MTHRTFSRIVVLTTCLLWLGLVHAVAQQEQIDWNKARQLHERMLKGEKLTEEEQAYHDRAAQALQAKAGKQPNDGIDWNKAQRLQQKFLRGEKLTDEERAYHNRAAQALRAKAGVERRPPPPAKPPVGLKPLTDMTANDRRFLRSLRIAADEAKQEKVE